MSKRERKPGFAVPFQGNVSRTFRVVSHTKTWTDQSVVRSINRYDEAWMFRIHELRAFLFWTCFIFQSGVIRVQ